MAQLAVALALVGESRRSAHRRQRCRNKDHSQQHHYPSSYAHSTSFLSVGDGLCRRDGGLLEGPAGFCAEPSRCLCEPFVCRCSPISSHLQSGSDGEIEHPSKGLNSYPPKGLMPKGLPLRQRTGATGLVRSGCRRFPVYGVLLGNQASGIRGSRKPGCLRPHTLCGTGAYRAPKGPWCVRSRALILPLGLGGWVYQGPKEGSGTHVPAALLPYTLLSLVLGVAHL